MRQCSAYSMPASAVTPTSAPRLTSTEASTPTSTGGGGYAGICVSREIFPCLAGCAIRITSLHAGSPGAVLRSAGLGQVCAHLFASRQRTLVGDECTSTFGAGGNFSVYIGSEVLTRLPSGFSADMHLITGSTGTIGDHSLAGRMSWQRPRSTQSIYVHHVAQRSSCRLTALFLSQRKMSSCADA